MPFAPALVAVPTAIAMSDSTKHLQFGCTGKLLITGSLTDRILPFMDAQYRQVLGVMVALQIIQNLLSYVTRSDLMVAV